MCFPTWERDITCSPIQETVILLSMLTSIWHWDLKEQISRRPHHIEWYFGEIKRIIVELVSYGIECLSLFDAFLIYTPPEFNKCTRHLSDHYSNQAKVLIPMWLLIKYSCKYGSLEFGLFWKLLLFYLYTTCSKLMVSKLMIWSTFSFFFQIRCPQFGSRLQQPGFSYRDYLHYCKCGTF